MLTRVFLSVLLAAVVSATAVAQTDSGTASKYPFSAYWYPHAEGGLTGPLSKYDQVYRTRAAAWEQANHVNADNVQPWFGHCHAFAAAACTEEEPAEALDYKGVNFGVGDLKGLLVALHAQDEATNYGDRYGDGQGGDDPADISPDEVWRLCQLYVKQRGIPLIFDMEGGDEVWNFPCYQYEVSYQEEGGGWVNGTMTLVVADDDVDPDYVGTQPSVYSYTFRCRMQGGSIVAGSGQWTGENATDHPDFAWYPYVARAENPEVDPQKVAQILGKQVGGGANPPDDMQDRPPDNLPPGHDPDGDGPRPPENALPPEGLESPPLDGGAVRPAPLVNFDQVLSPIETVSLIANKTSHFGLDVFVDRNDGGKYRPGEPIGIAVESRQEGYLYLFDIDPAGNLSLVFPRAGEGNFIPANKLIDIPPRDAKPWFLAQGPGEHHLRALVTTAPLALTGFHTLSQSKLKEKGKHKITRTAPQKMRVPPTTYARVKNRLTGYYSSKSIEYKPPAKVKGFAQDDCMYFVVGQ